MEDIWLRHAKRLQALASTGAAYTLDRYDLERYQEISLIALEMIAHIGTVPIERVQGLIGPFAQGYVTPKVDVRGAIIVDDKILLVRERTDGLWSLPGGFADIGFSPAENIAKEIREETGFEVNVESLIGVRHKAKGPYEPDARDFYKLFFACTVIGPANCQLDADIVEYGFFKDVQIPPLSLGRTSKEDVEMAFAHHRHDHKAFFN